MLDVMQAEAAVVRCLGEPSALDAIPAIPDAFACRVAKDEVMLLGPRAAQETICAQAAKYLSEADPHALALEQADGWSIWTLTGPEANRAFARLSAILLPESRPAFVQGTIGGIPGKALALSDCIHLMVMSALGHHLRDRIFAACADLKPNRGEARPLVVDSSQGGSV